MSCDPKFEALTTELVVAKMALELLRSERDRLASEARGAAVLLARMIEQRDKDEADAKRWCWWTAQLEASNYETLDAFLINFENQDTITKAQLDAAIDEAMKESV